MTYLITFTCYGAHVHGDARVSVDRKHNVPGTRMLDENFNRAFAERRLMDQRPHELDQPRRQIVLDAIIERCSNRGWELTAAHVRTNHVHVIVAADAPAERVMNDLKSYSSRLLNRARLDTPDRKRWARHGSTRRLFQPDDVEHAIRYVVEKQGDPMAFYIAGPQG